jgi:tousled-like kinase
MHGLPADVKAVFGNLGSSNEARMALLERRFAIPPSPVGSGDGSSKDGVAGHNQNSMGSVGSGRPQGAPLREATPSASLGGEGAHSQDGGEAAGGGQAGGRKRRAQLDLDGPPRPPRADRAVTPSLQRPSLSPYLAGGEGLRAQQASTPGSKGKQRNTISRYFAHTGGDPAAAAAGAPRDAAAPEGAAPAAAAAASAFAAEVETLRCGPLPPARYAPHAWAMLITPPRSHAPPPLDLRPTPPCRQENLRLAADLQRAQEGRHQLEGGVQRLEREAAEAKQQGSAREGDMRACLLRLATTAARQERELSAQQLQRQAPRLGSLSVRRRGIEVQETWEDGAAFADIHARLAALGEQREGIEGARKAAKRRLPLPGQPLPAERHGGGEAAAAPGAPAPPLHPDDWVVQEEVYRVRLAALRREEDALRAELGRLEIEKHAYVRELKRVRDEEGSRFNGFPVLNSRYLLLGLLGRGGFSEVYRAFDLSALREVACKIHQLSAQWSEAKKASYVKHSVREYHIHRGLHHPRIVSLLDIFEIDNNTFATVLELCTGGDLDAYCRAHEALPEREARAVVAQVLSGLAYLNTKPRNVIHYDLKPANILFDALGECKITDFGLSKVVEEGHTQGVELTSQGAGTYWYLPPECFDVAATPLISNKVDVWSVGVILYQMLFGRRPFGHDQSQEQILRQGVMLNAREVQFPPKPSVSAECKDFVRRCLAYRQEDRMDVHAAANHPYMCFKKEKRASGAGAGRDGGAAAAAPAPAGGLA